MNQIVNMLFRIVMRKVMNKGINMGMEKMSRGKDRRGGAPQHSDVDQQKMRQTSKLSRKINRF